MINVKLQLLRDLISCNAPIGYWYYDEEGNILDHSDEVQPVYHTIFLFSHCFEATKKHFEQTKCPLILSIGIGLMWCVVIEEAEERHYFHVLGPVFFNTVSHADVRRNLRPLEDAGLLNLKRKHQIMDSIYTVPVMSYTMMLQYALWLHYCVNGEKLSVTDVSTERSSHKPEHAKRPVLDSDLHRTYMVERALLTCVQNGNLNYKDIWAKAIQMDVFDKPYASSPLESKKISCIQFTKLCAHYASLGGLSPAVSYNLEASYIQAISSANHISVLQTLQNDILDTYIRQVHSHNKALEQNISREIQMSREYVLMHVESDLTLEAIAAHVGYTPYYFSRKFKQETGESINHYIKVQKIEHSKTLLMSTDLSIQEIADKLSLCSPTYFSSAFRSLVGCSPTEYRLGRTVETKE